MTPRGNVGWEELESLDWHIYTIDCCHSAESCPIICNPVDCSMPGFPVHHHFPEFARGYVHWIGDAIQPSHPLSPSSPSAFNLSQHQGLFPMSHPFASCGQSIGASALVPVLPKTIRGLFPLRLPGLISLFSKGVSRVFSRTTVWKFQFLGALPLLSGSHSFT